MTKSLEDAIGCWTVNPVYNGLPLLSKSVREAAGWCRNSTLRNNTSNLSRDLRILRARLDTMLEVVDSAEKRLKQIVETKELR